MFICFNFPIFLWVSLFNTNKPMFNMIFNFQLNWACYFNIWWSESNFPFIGWIGIFFLGCKRLWFLMFTFLRVTEHNKMLWQNIILFIQVCSSLQNIVHTFFLLVNEIEFREKHSKILTLQSHPFPLSIPWFELNITINLCVYVFSWTKMVWLNRI